jgi:ribonuclease P protein component
VLPAANRLRSSADFAAVTRLGERARKGSLVAYLRLPSDQSSDDVPVEQFSRPTESAAGLIVGKAVGGSVIRHRVSRRLRAQLSCRISRLPAGSQLVIRALPQAATAESAALGSDLDGALAKLTGRAARR